MSNPSYAWIVDSAGLSAVDAAVRGAGWVAIDTESNSMFAYRERVCLIQVRAADSVWLVDPIAMSERGGATLEPLREVLEDPAIDVFVHGGEYDVAVLKREFDLALAGVFDSQQAASFLGLPRTGYAAVVAEICKVEIPKGYSQYDWSARPIDDEAIRYALDDVLHLPEVANGLRDRIASADLEEELSIANRAVEAAAPHSAVFDPSRMHRLKGARDLGPEQLAVLTALYALREELGKSADKPPGRILANDLLVHLARKSPRDHSDLRRMKLRRQVVSRYGQRLVECVAGAIENPPEIPTPVRKPKLSRSQQRRETRLKNWRRREAERRGVPLQVVLPARALEFIREHGTAALASVPELGSKRAKLYGRALSELCGPDPDTHADTDT